MIWCMKKQKQVLDVKVLKIAKCRALLCSRRKSLESNARQCASVTQLQSFLYGPENGQSLIMWATKWGDGHSGLDFCGWRLSHWIKMWKVKAVNDAYYELHHRAVNQLGFLLRLPSLTFFNPLLLLKLSVLVSHILRLKHGSNVFKYIWYLVSF